MADYGVEEESTFWPWVIGIVVLALVIWVAAELSDDSAELDGGGLNAPVAPGRATAVAPAAIDSLLSAESFRTWVGDSTQSPDLGSEAYARAGMIRLSAVLRAAAGEVGDTMLQQRAMALRQQLERGTVPAGAMGDSGAVGLMDTMREATDLAAAIHEQRRADADAARDLRSARDALAEIDPATDLQQQRHRLHRFFDFLSQSLVSG